MFMVRVPDVSPLLSLLPARFRDWVGPGVSSFEFDAGMASTARGCAPDPAPTFEVERELDWLGEWRRGDLDEGAS